MPNAVAAYKPPGRTRISRPPRFNYEYENIQISRIVTDNDEEQRLQLVKYRGTLPVFEDNYTAILDGGSNQIIYRRENNRWVNTSTNQQAYDNFGNPSDHSEVDLEISDILKVENDSWAVMFRGWPKSEPMYYTTDEITCNGRNKLLLKFLKYMNDYCAPGKWQYLGGKKGRKKIASSVILDEQIQKMIRENYERELDQKKQILKKNISSTDIDKTFRLPICSRC